jgi:hypothetical protein
MHRGQKSKVCSNTRGVMYICITLFICYGQQWVNTGQRCQDDNSRLKMTAAGLSLATLLAHLRVASGGITTMLSSHLLLAATLLTTLQGQHRELRV